MKLRPGDIVELNSGSPPLTVQNIDPDTGQVEVAWPGTDARIHVMTAPAACFSRLASDFDE